MVEIKNRVKGYLALASGRIFEGYLFGAIPPEKAAEFSFGEVVFNTSLTGYQEILTDPSYQGQIVVMTSSHIGNTGVNLEDVESRKVFLSGFVVQELSSVVSNWRASQSLHDYMAQAGIVGIAGVDTRALTRHLRTQGAVTGLIARQELSPEALIKKAKTAPGLEGRDLVKEVTSDDSYNWKNSSGSWVDPNLKTSEKKFKVVVMDFGVKQNILRSLIDRKCDVTVVPASATSAEILKHNPDGILLSNGPGDPAAVEYAITAIRELVSASEKKRKAGEKDLAIFGICLGHQLLGLACGGTTYKLKFGHHGANHPIKDLETGQVDITSQNHGFCVQGEKTSKGDWILKGNKDIAVTHINLNDNAIEGIRHKTLPIFSVQYHPEASAGPHDASHLFDRFIKFMESGKN